MSRRTGSKDQHGRYSTPEQMKARALKLMASINKFTEQAYRQRDFNKLVDFNKLYEVSDHLAKLSALKIE
jgi:hypothetical protein